MADEPSKVEIGTTGLNRFGGQVYEEFLTELQGQRGIKIYKEMSNNDAIVGAILFAIEMALREVPWFTEPEGSKEAKFLQECMRDMSHTWRDFISEILSMLPFGYSWFEIVYKKRDGEKSNFSDNRIGWRKFGYRAPETLVNWIFDDEGGIRAFVQSSAPSYNQIVIPIEKSILFRTRKHKNNPEGRSVLRNAYRSWYFKTNLEALEGISLERSFAGLPVMHLPQGASTGTGASDEAAAKSIVRKIRIDEQMGVVLPNGWDLKLEGSEGRGLDVFGKSISRYRQEIMLSVLATFIALGMEKVGSFALARESRDFFQIALQGWIDNISETLNEFAVPKLLKLNNFDPMSARIKSGTVGQVDLEVMSNYIMRLSQVGALNPDPPLETYLREVAGLPSRIEEDLTDTSEVGKEVHKAEDWHPQLKKRPVTLQEMKKVEGDLERSVRRFFQGTGDMDSEELDEDVAESEKE